MKQFNITNKSSNTEVAMKQLKRFSGTVFILLFSLAFSLMFFSCERNEQGTSITGPQVENPNAYQNDEAASSWWLAKGKNDVLIDEIVVKPKKDAKLTVGGDNINDAEFQLKKVDVPGETMLHLEKASMLSNIYRLEPFGISTKEIKIKLYYTHTALPLGITKNDLRIFQRVNNEWVALATKVQGYQRKLEAKAATTGEFAMGALDANGKALLLGGEFGLRIEKKCKKNKKEKIKLGYGSEINVMKNSLSTETVIGIIATAETIQGIGDSKNFTFTPHGTVFNEPIELNLSWAEMAGQNITLYYFNELTGEWEVNAEGVWDLKKKVVTLKLQHFSRYALAAD